MTGETSYDVRIWKTQIYRGARTTTHTVRWGVAGRPWAPHGLIAAGDTIPARTGGQPPARPTRQLPELTIQQSGLVLK